MKFLTVLVIVFLYRNWIGDNPVRQAIPFAGYVEWVKGLVKATYVRYLVCVGVPSIAVLLISFEISNWLFGLVWLLLSLVILVYSTDVHDTDQAFEDQETRLNALTASDPLDEEQQKQDDFKLLTTYEVFQSLYPALFWFLVLGPGGALFYVLSRQYLDHLEDEDPELELIDQVLHWLEWPAARVTGLVFAFVGRFADCFDEWLQTIADVQQAVGSYLVQMADAAIEEPATTADIQGWARETVVANGELRELLTRTIFGWLAIAAIVAILGL